MALPPRRPIRRTAAKPAEPPAPAPAQCAKCQAPLEAKAEFCGECGAPVKANAKPKRSMVEIRRKMEKSRNAASIQSGRNTMLWLGLAHLVIGLIVYIANKGELDQLLSMRQQLVDADITDPKLKAQLEQGFWVARHWGAICFVTYGLPGLILFGLYGWARSNPLPATIAGLVTYLTFLVVGFALNPASLISPVGWVIRVAIIGALTSAIRSASTERRIRERERERKRRAEAESGDAEGEGLEEPA